MNAASLHWWAKQKEDLFDDNGDNVSRQSISLPRRG
jgi:hypothetical protein